MSFPIFSQIDTESKELICISYKNAKNIVSELVYFDLCKQENDSLLYHINDLNNIVSQQYMLLERYDSTTDSLLIINNNLLDKTTYQSLDIVSKEDKIKRLRNTRNVTILTTLLTAVLPVVLNKE